MLQYVTTGRTAKYHGNRINTDGGMVTVCDREDSSRLVCNNILKTTSWECRPGCVTAAAVTLSGLHHLDTYSIIYHAYRSSLHGVGALCASAQIDWEEVYVHLRDRSWFSLTGKTSVKHQHKMLVDVKPWINDWVDYLIQTIFGCLYFMCGHIDGPAAMSRMLSTVSLSQSLWASEVVSWGSSRPWKQRRLVQRHQMSSCVQSPESWWRILSLLQVRQLIFHRLFFFFFYTLLAHTRCLLHRWVFLWAGVHRELDQGQEQNQSHDKPAPADHTSHPQ